MTKLKEEQLLPQEALLKLFCAPLNIQDNTHLMRVVENYFEFFKEVSTYFIIEFSADGGRAIGTDFLITSFDNLRDIKLPRDMMGTIKEVKVADKAFCATPIYEKNGYYHWLIVDVDSSKSEYILNHLLFKFLENVFIYKKTKEKQDNFEVLASTDDVTGLYNQRKLAQDLEDAVLTHQKNHDTFSIMFIDVDHFKNVNDDFGHLVGSHLLLQLGKLLNLLLRDTDHIYRYGGDEFVIIMPTVDIKTVHHVALRILKQIKAHEFKTKEDKVYKMSVSIGIAEYPTDASSAMDIIEFADKMMYKSKSTGRGKVFHVGEVADVDISSK